MTRDGESSKQAEKRAKRSRTATLAASMPQRNEGIRISDEGSNSPTIPEGSNQNVERSNKKRGPAKLKMVPTSTSGEDPRPILQFNERGQVLGPYSSKLSSDTGYMVRHKVPIVIDTWGAVDAGLKNFLWEFVQQHYIIDDSHKDLILQKMRTQWRQYKSSITRQILETVKNGEMPNRLSSIRPNNVKSDKEWEVFVKGRLSPEFKAKSDKFKEIRKKQTIVHTMSRKGYARLEDEMKKKAPESSTISRVDVWTRGHIRKNGEPVNEAVGDVVAKLQELTQSTSTQQSTNSIRDDALSQVLGPERRGRVRGLGYGVTPSRVDAQGQSTGRVKQLEENLLYLQSRFDELEAKFIKQAEQAQSKNVEDTIGTRATTPQANQNSQSENSCGNLVNARCELLDWNSYDTKVVAQGKVASTDPATLVHHIPLGAACWKVWVDQVFDKMMPMFRPTQEMSVLEDAIGSTTSWPSKFIRLL